MPIIVDTQLTSIEGMHDLLLPELPGCTVAMLNFHLREVAREFCVKTSAWRETLAAVNTVASQATYSLTAPDNSEIVRVTGLTVNSILLWKHSDREEAGTDSETPPKYGVTEPPFKMARNLDQIVLATDEVPTAAVTGGLVVEAALKPTATATALPDFLLTQYSEALRYGTLSRLMVMNKKPWTDRELAGYYEQRWHAALNFAAYQGQVGNTRQPLRVRKWG